MLGTPTIYFDCDDTLVLWGNDGFDLRGRQDAKKFKCYGNKYHLLVHSLHVEKLKEHKREGFKIVVWSAGGQEWAEEVVRVLGLKDYVDVCLSKPEFFYDDITAPKFMHEHKRIYLKPIEQIDLKTILEPIEKVEDGK